MPAYVIVHRPPASEGFELYVTTAPTGTEALSAVVRKFDLKGGAEVNGKPLFERDTKALDLAPDEIRQL